MAKVPTAHVDLEFVNVRREDCGARVTRGVIDSMTEDLTVAATAVFADHGLVADDVHVDTTYGYEISTAARHARKRSA